MNRNETLIVALLFATLIGWGFYQSKRSADIKKNLPPPPVAEVQQQGAADAPAEEASAIQTPAAEARTSLVSAPSGGAASAARELKPERRIELRTDNTVIRMTSHGGGIAEAELLEFNHSLDPDQGPVILDFAGFPALAYSGVPGLGSDADFEIQSGPDGRSATVRARSDSGISLTRRIVLEENYRISVSDTFLNISSNAVALPPHGISVGPMRLEESKSKVHGFFYLGLDTLASGEKAEVKHWSKKLNSFFGAKGGGCSTPSARGLPVNASQNLGEPLDWLAAKNKFFVQILAPESGGDNCIMLARRDASSTNALVVAEVAGEILFDEQVVPVGGTVTKSYSYYLGPKKYAALKDLGNRQREVMQFGWWEWYRQVCRALLWTLNIIHRVIPDYGLAIILLTFLVRLVFWPVLKKSTDHMKRMQKVQPLMAEIRKKHKDDSQKMNQAMMALYREHKVNPMAGCLPMLIQMPVFFALFTVLRSAVELRFASFLWVRDLSEPERLLADVLPIPLNILPLLMTATTVLQQKLTPSSADPAQQRMMMLMPVMFLFLLYNMPSALLLYWTTSQALSILQLKLQKTDTGDIPDVKAPKPKADLPGWKKQQLKQRKRKKS